MHSRLTIKGYIILSKLMQSSIYDKLYDVSLKFSKTDSFPVIYYEIGGCNDIQSMYGIN